MRYCDQLDTKNENEFVRLSSFSDFQGRQQVDINSIEKRRRFVRHEN
jgi:hypothetical protein